MCLIVFAYQTHPDYPLIVMANRDEYYRRPTAAAHWWKDSPTILAGKDLKGNGSWFGVNKDGDFAALTNFRDGFNLKIDAPTRGTLVSNFLEKKPDIDEYLTMLKSRAEWYNGYNLLLKKGNRFVHYSNQEQEHHELAPGIYGLSNAVLDTPWEKVNKGKAYMEELIKTKDFDINLAFESLQDSELAEDSALPSTGVPYQWEKKLSAMCIKTQNYGTRCSTVLMMNQQDEIYFEERSYVPDTGAVTFEFKT